MTEQLAISGDDKEQKYASLLPQIKALIGQERDWIANLSNVAAALQQSFSFLWVGFYRVVEQELVLGPFQGPIACSRIKKGMGVCGTAWQIGETIIVPNVDKFPGHIACSSFSKSEIVVPVRDTSSKIVFVLDIDSEQLNHFDFVDQKHLEQLALLITASLDQ